MKTGLFVLALSLIVGQAYAAKSEFNFSPDQAFLCEGKVSKEGQIVPISVKVQNGVMTYKGPHSLKSRTRYVQTDGLTMLVEPRGVSGQEVVAGFATAYSIDWLEGERESFASIGVRHDDGKAAGSAFMLVQMGKSLPGGGLVSVVDVSCKSL